MLNKFVGVFGRAQGAALGLLVLMVASLASAQTGDWDLSAAQTTQTGLLTIGAALVIGLTIFGLAKRSARKV